MATQAAPSFATKFGFGFPRAREPKAAGPAEDWYIPYNGPYEAPREHGRREKARDSWGDPLEIDDEEDTESVLAAKEGLDLRYGGSGHGHGSGRRSEDQAPPRRSSGFGGRGYADEEDYGRGRDRTVSVLSASSSALDPPRGVGNRRSTVSTATGPPLPSYVSLSAVGGGGVGESPAPPRHRSRDGNRISIASIFSGFGAAARKLPGSPVSQTHRRQTSGGSASSKLWHHDKQTGLMLFNAPSPASHASSSSSYSPQSNGKIALPTPRTRTQTVPQPERLSALVTDDEDYYNTYYNTLRADSIRREKGPRVTPSKTQGQAKVLTQRSLPHMQKHSRTPSTTSTSNSHSQSHSNNTHTGSNTYSNSNAHSNSNTHSNATAHSPRGGLSRQNSSNASTSGAHPYAAAYAFPTSTIAAPTPPTTTDVRQATSPAEVRLGPSASLALAQLSSNAGTTYTGASSGRTSGYTSPNNTTTTYPNTITTATNNYPNNANTSAYPNSTANSPRPAPPRLTLTAAGPSSADAAHLAFSPRARAAGRSLVRALKNSISSPDLRTPTSSYQGRQNDANTRDKDATKGAPQTAANAAAAGAPTFVFPRGKERWLSAETWCDALLFPRPRLRLKQEILAASSSDAPGSPGGGGNVLHLATGPASPSGRIVSPPLTPIGSGFDHDDDDDVAVGKEGKGRKGGRESAIASRVLAYSRSLVDLSNKGKGKEEARPGYYASGGPQTSMRRDVPRPRAQTQTQTHRQERVVERQERQVPVVVNMAGQSQTRGKGQVGQTEKQPMLRPPRPKSFSWDDLDLPSPVPSLAHVLREGELLDAQRKAWQTQAQRSLGNARSRSMSRTRAKSLTQKARREGRIHHQHQSSMEYIAAQACLGTQGLSPPIAPQRFNFQSGSMSGSDSVSGGHSHSNSHSTSQNSASLGGSLAKTLTGSKASKASGAHSRTHSRSDSWSKSALRAAKNTVICGFPSSDGGNGGSSQTRVGDLEGALRTQGTRVIRLADPVHLPVDRGTPNARQTPSPAFSAISDSKVGIALGTPPDEVESGGPSYMLPAHPYAQGGLSFSQGAPTTSAPEHRRTDFAGPHPSMISSHTKAAMVGASGGAPAISDILARHKLPPHIALHPYAQQPASNRDSYIDANGLIGLHRSGDDTPHAAKMWAQISPGVVREILPGDIQYSPFVSDAEDSPVVAHRNTIAINDTLGVGETLVNATARFRAGLDGGQGASQKKVGWTRREEEEEEEERNILPAFGAIGRKAEPQIQRPVDLQESRTDSNNSADSAFAPQHIEYLRVSPAATSSSSSPMASPRPLGSPHDLDSFQDLFYRPSANHSQRTPSEAALPDTPGHPSIANANVPWDVSLRHHRTGSGLTSLARQLNEEFEQIAMDRERERTNSQYSHSGTMSSRQPSSMLRRPTEGSLQFVFEEMPMSTSPPDHLNESIHAFKASDTLPEDVLSSRASSFIENGAEEDDDPTALFRVGIVESVSTPPIESSEMRRSYTGETSFPHSEQSSRNALRSPASPDSHARIVSGLQPSTTTEATRSSYMTTTSDLSRMSGLSDFPAPPKSEHHMTPKHMSLLSSYFDEALSRGEARAEPMPGPSSVLDADGRVTFGNNQNAADLVKTLSSPQVEPPF